MGLEYRHIPRDAGEPVDTVKVDRHWYLTEDKDRVVPEGDPAARWLWATPDMDVPRTDAERLGAVPAAARAAETDVEEDTEEDVEEVETVKEQPAPPNKQRPKPDTKAKPLDVAELREQAVTLGVTVDKRWGPDRLRQEIAKASEAD